MREIGFRSPHFWGSKITLYRNIWIFISAYSLLTVKRKGTEMKRNERKERKGKGGKERKGTERKGRVFAQPKAVCILSQRYPTSAFPSSDAGIE